jgi:hypothetical protein
MVRSTVVLAAVVLLSSPLPAQQAPTRATRSDGSVVLLYPDGTWKPGVATPASKTTAASRYEKPANATATLEILKTASLSYDPTKWQRETTSTPGRQMLRHESGDGYALIIAERLQIPMASFKQIVLTNARSAAPDAKLVAEEVREVNGVPVSCLQITGTAQGLAFHYFGYYYTGKLGSVQVITYTGETLFEEYKPDFEELLNGLELPRS